MEALIKESRIMADDLKQQEQPPQTLYPELSYENLNLNLNPTDLKKFVASDDKLYTASIGISSDFNVSNAFIVIQKSFARTTQDQPQTISINTSAKRLAPKASTAKENITTKLTGKQMREKLKSIK